MKTVACYNLGRFGNRLFRAAKALALAEQIGAELRMEAWEGERIFTLDGWTPKRPDGTEDIVIDGYCQNQQSLIYSRSDCRRWFKLRPEVEEKLKPFASNGPVGHIRKGDFISAGYPVLTESAIRMAAHKCGLPVVHTVSDEWPTKSEEFTGDLAMLPDFYIMMTAPILFRANSTYSYWASVLGNGLTFSPVITGLAGGVEHDNVPYVEGNWPRLAELPNITDLHLKE